jgi:DNA-binding FadR family transcriptional regulator
MREVEIEKLKEQVRKRVADRVKAFEEHREIYEELLAEAKEAGATERLAESAVWSVLLRWQRGGGPDKLKTQSNAARVLRDYVCTTTRPLSPAPRLAKFLGVPEGALPKAFKALEAEGLVEFSHRPPDRHYIKRWRRKLDALATAVDNPNDRDNR